MTDKIELPGEVNRYQLVCFVNEPDTESKPNFVTEYNVSSNDGMFGSIEEAWERNDEMGSRWAFYPFRVILDQEGTIASLEDGMNQRFVGCNCIMVSETIRMLIDDLSE